MELSIISALAIIDKDSINKPVPLIMFVKVRRQVINPLKGLTATNCNTLQHTATHCNMLHRYR